MQRQERDPFEIMDLAQLTIRISRLPTICCPIAFTSENLLINAYRPNSKELERFYACSRIITRSFLKN